MPEAAGLTHGGPFPEIQDAFTQKRTWGVALGFLAVLVFMVRWPNIFGIIWEFSLLCCFPAGLFIWAAVSSGAVRKPPMTKIVIMVVALQSAVGRDSLSLEQESEEHYWGFWIRFCRD